jgi:hypothetical protein
MAGELQDPSIGWGGEVHLSTDETTGNLEELVQVVSFGLPNDEVDEVEVTHLKSPNRRKEYIAGLGDGGEVEVVLNYRPGSDTDILLLAAKAARNTRAVRFVIPNNGVPAYQVDTFAYVSGYDRGTVSAGEKMEVTVTFRITGDETQAPVTP